MENQNTLSQGDHFAGWFSQIELWLLLVVLLLLTTFGKEVFANDIPVSKESLAFEKVRSIAVNGKVNYKFTFRISEAFINKNDIKLDVEKKDEINQSLKASLGYSKDSKYIEVVSAEKIRFTLGRKTFSFVIKDSTETRNLRESLIQGISDWYVSLASDLRIPMKRGTDTLIVTHDIVRNLRFSRTLSAGEINDIVRETEGYDPQYKTRMNAAIEPIKSDSLDKQGFFDFAFSQRLPFNFLSGAQAAISGVLSSDKNSPSSVIRITPLSLKLTKKDYFYLDFGYDINQSGSLETLRLSAYWDFLLPFNLVNLTQGENRLRLFPVMTVGANLLRYTQAEDASVPSERTYLEGFFDMYYYIPVYDRYSLLVEGEAFWRNNQNGDFHSDDARWQWDFTLGYEIKGGGTKVMAKYSVGVDRHSFEKDEKILIGVLFDLFDQTEE